MRIMGCIDRELAAKEYKEFFRGIGYEHISVYVPTPGEISIIILGGRLRAPRKRDIAKFNRNKIHGVCYEVDRFICIFGRSIRLWSNRNWDVD